MARRDSLFKSSVLFSPSIMRKLTYDSAVIAQQNASVLSESNVSSTASFRYDSPWMPGIRSTQQIPVDFSQFENHCFFNSAESKVNIAFSKVINEYPFDGTKKEIETYFDNLTGYEKYVYDEFPKWVGFVHFSGTAGGESPENGFAPGRGQYIRVKDIAGSYLPSISKRDDAKIVIGPKEGSISFEMQLYVPEQPNLGQVVLQKVDKDKFRQTSIVGQYAHTDGITIGLEESLSSNYCSLFMAVSSGSSISSSPVACVSASMPIRKGRFNHICAVWDRAVGQHNIKLYQSGILINQSRTRWPFGELSYNASDLLIGSGSLSISGSINPNTNEPEHVYFAPQQTFSGAIDELRIWSTSRNPTAQKLFQFKNTFAGKNLKLYYKFNEVTGSYTNNSITLDSSGNSLHSFITNFEQSSRSRKGLIVPLKNERHELNPVLFPYYPDVMELNSTMLYSGSTYDANNPNLITKLVPSHYFQESRIFDGLQNEYGDLGKPFATGSVNLPTGGDLGSPQIITLLLFMWAKYFDELKMYVDQFSKLLTVDYNPDDAIAEQFLTFLGEYYGFTLPNFYSTATATQYNDGENLLADPSYSKFSLRHVQNQLWRRILVNLLDIIRSKGTTHSVKALIRAIGMNPDNNFRFREFGGALEKSIMDSRRFYTDHIGMLDFSGTLDRESRAAGTLSSQGISSHVPFTMSPFLSGSRTEVGMPRPRGNMVMPEYFPPHGISDQPPDGLFTSGSFTYEALYRFNPYLKNPVRRHFMTQSLMRLHVTASFDAGHGVLFNLLAMSESLKYGHTGSIQLLGNPSGATNHRRAPNLHMVLTGVNIFDGNPWYISWGRRCAEEIGSIASSSYFLRVGRQSYGDLIQYHASSTLYREWGSYSPGSQLDALRIKFSAGNASGSFICIGSQSFANSTRADGNCLYLNYGTYGTAPGPTVGGPDQMPLFSEFSGQVGRVRFWSKALADREAREHIRNPKSVGVINPLTNFNFTHTPSGSFEKLRLDVWMQQTITGSGVEGSPREITLFDYTQNFSSGTKGMPWRLGQDFSKVLFAMSGTGFEPSTRVIKPLRVDYSFINPKFDERSEINKIRVRSWQEARNEEYYGGESAPVFEVLKSETPIDDTRFIIENSFVQALDEDIINIFGTLEKFNNILGAPELLYAWEYPDLRHLRDIYFNRLKGRIKIKEFFEFFKWFDDSIGILIEKLIPQKTTFLGVQFTIESHMLERAKFRYDYADQYIPSSHKLIKGDIPLPQDITPAWWWLDGDIDSEKLVTELDGEHASFISVMPLK